jgi:hypothetical protein
MRCLGASGSEMAAAEQGAIVKMTVEYALMYGLATAGTGDALRSFF